MASGTAGGRIAPGVGANLIGQHSHDRNQDATVYVGNLDAQVHSSFDRVWLQVLACASACICITVPGANKSQACDNCVAL